MKGWARWSLLGAGALALVVGGVIAAGAALAERKLNRRVDVPVAPVALPDDPARVAHGRYLYESRGCTDCHGLDGGGRMVIDDGSMRVRGPQISPGPASATASYRVEDWVRAIRHGVDPAGRALIVMPSEDYNRFTDEDLGALIAYLRGMPTVAGQARLVELPLPVRVLYAFGAIRDAAEKIDHRLPPEKPVPAAPDAVHGRYVANMCVGCHGPGLSGGKVPGGPPDWPATANLTPGEGTAMTRYADPRAFATMMRTGKRPDGTPIAVMPFEALAKMNEVDVAALHAYLKTLPPKAAGGR